MPGHLITQKEYLIASQVFHWATKEHYGMWFTGKMVRHRRTEAMLPRLVKKGRLVAKRYGKRLVYAAPRITNQVNVEHGLGCTEGLVRMWRSRTDATIIPERFFRGFGSVPEWGLLYPNGKLLLYEHCTADNFERRHVVKTKITNYQEHLPAIEEHFKGEAIVLFVIMASQEKVEGFVANIKVVGPFFFTDYPSFISVPVGKQLYTPIYAWGEDGQVYALAGSYA